jgi:hypothetical protein
VLVACPGFGADIDVAIAVHVCGLCFVTVFAGDDFVDNSVTAFAVFIFPYKRFSGSFGERTST